MLKHVETSLADSHVDLDLLRFPLVCVTEKGRLSDGERVQLMEALEELAMRRGRHAIILDLRLARPMPESQRTFIAETFQMHSDTLVQKWAGLAVVVRPPLLDNLPLGAAWVRVCPVPTKVFVSLEEADVWARLCVTRRETGEMQVPQGLGVNRRQR